MHKVLLVRSHTSLLQSHLRHADALLDASLTGDQSSKQLYALRASRVLGYPHLGLVTHLRLNRMRAMDFLCANIEHLRIYLVHMLIVNHLNKAHIKTIMAVMKIVQY